MSQINPTLADSPPLQQLEAALKQVPELKKLRRVQVCHSGTELRIFLETYTPPNQKEWRPKICGALQQVQLQTAYPVWVYGRKADDLPPVWRDRLICGPGNTWKAASSAQQRRSQPIGGIKILPDLPQDLSDLVASLLQQPFMRPVKPSLTPLLEQFAAQAPAVRWGAIALSCGAIVLGFAFCARALEPMQQRGLRRNGQQMAIAPGLRPGLIRWTEAS